MIGLLWRYKIPLLVLLLLAGNVANYHLGHFRGFSEGKEQARIEQLQDTLEKKEKMDEIRNNRPDTDTLVKRLRDGTF